MSGTAPCTPREFFQSLNIVTDDGPRRWGEVMADFQRADLESLENALRRVVGLPIDESLETVAQHYWEYSRMAAKTTTLAAIANYTVYASPRPFAGMIAAVDQDNARYVLDGVRLQVRENPHLSQLVRDPNDGKLKPLIQVLQNKICNSLSGSVIDVLATDAASAFGRNDLLVIIDEFSNIKPQHQSFFDAIYSGVAKRKYCTCIISANAPFKQSFQWPIRESFRTDPECRFSRFDGPSPLMTADRLAAVEKRTSPLAFKRLFLNQPVDGSGDLLTPELIGAAYSRQVPAMPTPDHRTYGYIAALDLALSKDFSALLVLGRDRTGRYRVAHCQVWKPRLNQKISLEAVQAAVYEAHRVFRFRRCVADPWQAQLLCETLRKRGVPIFARNQSGTALDEQCTALCDAFTSFNIDVPSDEHGLSLRNQLLSATIVAKSYGARFESPRNAATGHSDLLTCLSMALCESSDVLPIGTNSAWGGLITPSTRGLSTTRSDAAYQGWKFQQHLNALQGAGVEVLSSPYRTVGGEPAPEAAEHLRGNE